MHENILNYCRFKKSKIASIRPPATSVYRSSLSVSLLKLANSTVFLTFRSCLVLHSVSLNHSPCIILKDIAIWTLRHPEIKCDLVAEIFLLQRLGSCACVALYRVLLLDVGSSSSRSFDPI